MQWLSIHSIHLDQKYITEILKFNICDYNNAMGDLAILGHNLEIEKELTNSAHFIRCITKIDGQ